MANVWRIESKEQGKRQSDHLGSLFNNLENSWWHGPW